MLRNLGGQRLSGPCGLKPCRSVCCLASGSQAWCVEAAAGWACGPGAGGVPLPRWPPLLPQEWTGVAAAVAAVSSSSAPHPAAQRCSVTARSSSRPRQVAGCMTPPPSPHVRQAAWEHFSSLPPAAAFSLHPVHFALASCMQPHHPRPPSPMGMGNRIATTCTHPPCPGVASWRMPPGWPGHAGASPPWRWAPPTRAA